MFTEERQNAIEKCLREKGKVRVKELSEMFRLRRTVSARISRSLKMQAD